MVPLIKRVSKKAGMKPGALVHVGERHTDEVSVHVMDYDEASLGERDVDDITEVLGLKETASVSWIDITGLHETEVVKKLGEHFGLHDLIMEDILNTGNRPSTRTPSHMAFCH